MEKLRKTHLFENLKQANSRDRSFAQFILYLRLNKCVHDSSVIINNLKKSNMSHSHRIRVSTDKIHSFPDNDKVAIVNRIVKIMVKIILCLYV